MFPRKIFFPISPEFRLEQKQIRDETRVHGIKQMLSREEPRTSAACRDLYLDKDRYFSGVPAVSQCYWGKDNGLTLGWTWFRRPTLQWRRKFSVPKYFWQMSLFRHWSDEIRQGTTYSCLETRTPTTRRDNTPRNAEISPYRFSGQQHRLIQDVLTVHHQWQTYIV